MADNDAPTTPFEFMESVVIPTLNNTPWVAEADYLTAGGNGGQEVLDVIDDAGHHWQVTIALDPLSKPRLQTPPP